MKRHHARLRLVWYLALAASSFNAAERSSRAAPSSCPADAIEVAASDCPKCRAKPAASTATIPFTDKSIWQVQSSWTTDSGKTMKLGALRGKSQIVAMFFSSCRLTCPILVNQMKAIEAALPEGGRSKVGFTLVSFDSERDTPPVLKGFRARHELRADDWTLLHGEPDDARELAALLGVNYRKEANGEFAHSNLITLLNAEGEIVYQQNGLGHRPDEMIKQVKSLLNGLGRSSLKSSD